MKRTIAFMLALGLLLGTLATGDAAAGWFKKSKDRPSDKRTEKPEWMKQPVRRGELPRAEFHMGTLNRDAYSGWELDDMTLFVGRDCVVQRGGVETGLLEEGRQAVVMGPRVGNTIVAWQVRILEADYETRSYNSDVERLPSETDPTVGEIISAPY